MDLAGSAQLFASNALWRATGLRSAGRVLIDALGSEDETVRTIAGMFLTQAGSRAEPLLREALERRLNLPLVLDVIASIGDPRFEAELRRLSEDSDPEVAATAREAMRDLEMHAPPS